MHLTRVSKCVQQKLIKLKGETDESINTVIVGHFTCLSVLRDQADKKSVSI